MPKKKSQNELEMINFVDVPESPGAPEALDMDTTWVSLHWDRPDRDGGSKILGYHLEFREPSAHKWILVNPHACPDPRFTVESLRHCGEYEFRAIAKNAAGLSKPGPSSVIKLKPKYGPPGPPGIPGAETIGRNWCTLTWTPPIYDGGSKITGYIVERREIGSGVWVKCNDYNVRDCEFTVPDLMEFRTYEFRVIAVNSAGKGDPSTATSPIKIQEGGSKPEIVRKLFDAMSPLNKRVIFECEAVGKMPMHFRW